MKISKFKRMNKKSIIKNLTVGVVIVLVFIIGLPMVFLSLGKNGGVHNYSVTVIKTATGFGSGNFTFEIWLYNPSETVYEKLDTDTIGFGGGTLTFDFTSSSALVGTMIVESGANGATGATWSFEPDPVAQNNIINDTTDVITLSPSTNSKSVYFDNIYINITLPEPEQVWVRTMPMTCWHVWINEDNNFQFIFWYPFKDKNYVKIYDMEDNLVFETDLPKHDPNLIVELPDGMYNVETYHDQELLQEFLIGKP